MSFDLYLVTTICKNTDIKTRGEHFRFGSVFCQNSNQIFFFKKRKTNRNRTEFIQNRPISVRFGPVFLVKIIIKPNFIFGPTNGPYDGLFDGFSNKFFDGLENYFRIRTQSIFKFFLQ